MPVPVPRISQPQAHPVVKPIKRGIASDVDSLQNLTRTLPVSPTGPPPSLGTREQWLNSLPSWRRNKPRRIWEDDNPLDEIEQHQSQQVSTVPLHPLLRDGAHVEPCNTLSPPDRLSPHSPMRLDGDADDEMSSDGSVVGHGQYDTQSPWSADNSPCEVVMENQSQSRPHVIGDYRPAPMVDRGVFTPIFEEDFIGGREIPSSPMEAVTPFGQFVDRVVAAAEAGVSYSTASCDSAVDQSDHQYDYQDSACDFPCCQVQSRPAEPPVDAPLVTEPVVTAGATAAYKKLAEPLAEWVANYVWKACTTGMSLRAEFSRANVPPKQYPLNPPSYLAASVHSLLLSTLLQPSAVFLAVWYIVRLPVYFDAAPLGPDYAKAIRFRTELLGDPRAGCDRDGTESSAPFRLILLGCMLANKWLDDHTFSNKTWHLISNVPVHSLNRLESVTLDMFSHDLSIPSHTWSQWLAHVISYHLSLASPGYPQPISRPSTNPHSIVRMTIEELTQAPAACTSAHSARFEPVFLGLGERRKEKLEREETVVAGSVDIDLDKDGPLREEYLPKRRVSGAGSTYSWNASGSNITGHIRDGSAGSGVRYAETQRALPPPAKWSPAGDEPILREKTKISGPYLAVQPPLANPVTSALPYHPVFQDPYQGWTSGGGYVDTRPSAYSYDRSYGHVEPAYGSNSFSLPMPVSHARSYSVSRNLIDLRSYGHLRSHSQSQFESSMTHEYGPTNSREAQWPVIDHQYGYPSHGYPFVPRLQLDYPMTWLKT